MPELPEVETLCRQLNTLLPGTAILAGASLDPLLGPLPDLAGRVVERIVRRGKWLRISLTGGTVATLHLRMTGRLLWQPPEAPLPAYTRLWLSFAAGRLLLVDPRRFATFAVDAPEPAAPLLPDPLEALSAAGLRRVAAGRRQPVKAFLMDPRILPGIGNIYACEILHAAGVHPAAPAGALSADRWRRLVRSAGKVLPRAVACRGTTLSDWRDLHGRPGENQDHLAVYGREGKPCRRCGATVVRTVQAGRGTWHCPACQRYRGAPPP